MFTLSTKNQWLVGGILLAVMLITRAHVSEHLLDASWAVFLLAGFYLRNVLAFGVFMATAVAIDYVAVSQFGVSNFCVSSAYVALGSGLWCVVYGGALVCWALSGRNAGCFGQVDGSGRGGLRGGRSDFQREFLCAVGNIYRD